MNLDRPDVFNVAVSIWRQGPRLRRPGLQLAWLSPGLRCGGVRHVSFVLCDHWQFWSGRGYTVFVGGFPGAGADLVLGMLFAGSGTTTASLGMVTDRAGRAGFRLLGYSCPSTRSRRRRCPLRAWHWHAVG